MSNLSLTNGNKAGSAGASGNTFSSNTSAGTTTANKPGNYGTVAGGSSQPNSQNAATAANGNSSADEAAGLLVSRDLEMADVKTDDLGTQNDDNDDDVDGDMDEEDPETRATRMLKKTNLALLKKSSMLVMYFFAGVSAASVACVILGLLDFEVFELNTIWVMILINLMGSSFGAYGAYKWGTVEESIQDMSKQNDQFRSSMMSLDITKARLQSTVAELSESTRNLRQNSSEIKENLKSFEKVYSSLKNVGECSKDIYEAMDGINDMFAAMQNSIRVSKKATLMNIYYQVSFLCDKRSNNPGNRTSSADPGCPPSKPTAVGLDREEYEELLAMLNKEERQLFMEFGSFEELAGNDGIIDVFEFQELIDRAIRKLEERGSFDLRLY